MVRLGHPARERKARPGKVGQAGRAFLPFLAALSAERSSRGGRRRSGCPLGVAGQAPPPEGGALFLRLAGVAGAEGRERRGRYLIP